MLQNIRTVQSWFVYFCPFLYMRKWIKSDRKRISLKGNLLFLVKSFKILKLQPKVNWRIYFKTLVRCESVNDSWGTRIKKKNIVNFLFSKIIFWSTISPQALPFWSQHVCVHLWESVQVYIDHVYMLQTWSPSIQIILQLFPTMVCLLDFHSFNKHLLTKQLILLQNASIKTSSKGSFLYHVVFTLSPKCQIVFWNGVDTFNLLPCE